MDRPHQVPFEPFSLTLSLTRVHLKAHIVVTLRLASLDNPMAYCGSPWATAVTLLENNLT